MSISYYASVPTAMRHVGTSGKKHQIPFMGDLAKTTAGAY